MLQTLRQPRYVALSAVMLLVATICIGLGTWQISRLAGKHRANNELRHNDHASVAQWGTCCRSTAPSPSPRADDIQFRRVTMTGTYEESGQGLVRQRSVDDDVGYLVLTPLRTSTATVLVVRGFISSGGRDGRGHRTGATQRNTHDRRPSDAGRDHVRQGGPVTGRPDQLDQRQRAVQPTRRAGLRRVRRAVGGPTRNSGLVAIPEPDLSNPAGGAVEPQHLAYVIQWYLFAALALAAPIVMARAERRRVSTELDDEAPPITPADAKAARLADRYGRPAH